MKTARIDIGTIRREQIVEAASSIIADQGIQNLSLSEIESKVEMSRGNSPTTSRPRKRFWLRYLIGYC